MSQIFYNFQKQASKSKQALNESKYSVRSFNCILLCLSFTKRTTQTERDEVLYCIYLFRNPHLLHREQLKQTEMKLKDAKR